MRLTPVLLPLARPPWPALFAASAVAFLLIAGGAQGLILPLLCGGGRGAVSMSASDIGATVALNPLRTLFADWALMLLAMMPPLLAAPVMHVWRSSLVRRRALALASFVAGYGALWIAAGPLLLLIAYALASIVGTGAFWLAAILALGWSASPCQRRALNRGHRLPRIGLFGWRAQLDAIRFGVGHARWCLASCWPWMTLPLLAGSAHNLVMLGTALIMFTERLSPGDRPRWHLPSFLAVPQILMPGVAQRRPPAHG